MRGNITHWNRDHNMGADAEVTTVTSCLVRYHTVSVR